MLNNKYGQDNACDFCLFWGFNFYKVVQPYFSGVVDMGLLKINVLCNTGRILKIG